ncbi:MAG: hypothetical protein ACRDJW_09195 [Thermomicrobiales bacterium]
MVGRTPEEALDAFLDRFRRTVQCIAPAEMFGSGFALRRINSVTLIPHGGHAGSLVPLQTSDGRCDLLLAIYEQYTVVHVPDDIQRCQRCPFRISAAYYSYDIHDRNGREILLYQWRPEGVSFVTFPHLHVKQTNPISLDPGSRSLEPRTVSVSDMHLPTNHVLLEDIVELLVREFDIRSRREDWANVLQQNREMVRAGRL